MMMTIMMTLMMTMNTQVPHYLAAQYDDDDDNYDDTDDDSEHTGAPLSRRPIPRSLHGIRRRLSRLLGRPCLVNLSRLLFTRVSVIFCFPMTARYEDDDFI